MLHTHKLLLALPLLLIPRLVAHSHPQHYNLQRTQQECEQLRYEVSRLEQKNTFLCNKNATTLQKIALLAKKKYSSPLAKVLSWTMKTIMSITSLLFIASLIWWKANPDSFFSHTQKWFDLEIKNLLQSPEQPKHTPSHPTYEQSIQQEQQHTQYKSERIIRSKNTYLKDLQNKKIIASKVEEYFNKYYTDNNKVSEEDQDKVIKCVQEIQDTLYVAKNIVSIEKNNTVKSYLNFNEEEVHDIVEEYCKDISTFEKKRAWMQLVKSVLLENRINTIAYCVGNKISAL